MTDCHAGATFKSLCTPSHQHAPLPHSRTTATHHINHACHARPHDRQISPRHASGVMCAIILMLGASSQWSTTLTPCMQSDSYTEVGFPVSARALLRYRCMPVQCTNLGLHPYLFISVSWRESTFRAQHAWPRSRGCHLQKRHLTGGSTRRRRPPRPWKQAIAVSFDDCFSKWGVLRITPTQL